MMLDLVSAGLGYTVLPYSGVTDAVTSGAVCAAPIRGLRIAWVVAQSRDRSQTNAVQRASLLLGELCSTAVQSHAWPTAVM